MKYNCPNCGGTIEYDIDKYPFCGIHCLDLSHIDFNEKVPIILKFKIGKGDGVTYITQLVIPAANMEAKTIEQEITDSRGYLLYKIPIGVNIHTDFSFDSKPMHDGSTAIIKNKEMKTIWK